MIHCLNHILKWLNGHKSIVLLELLLLSMYPYALCYFWGFANIGTFLILFAFLSSIILFIKSGVRLKNDMLTKYVLFMCFFNFAYSVLHGDSSYITRIILSLTAYFFIYGINKFSGIKSFVKTNDSIITIQAVLAGIAFLLFLFGIIQRGPSFPNVDTRPCFSFGISFSNIVVPPIARMSGYFDEPGALAFWGVYALIFNALFVKNKYIEYGLIIGLIFTLSMAYFIMLAMYILFFKATNLKTLLPLLAILLFMACFAINSQNDSYLYTMTFERFEKASNGETGRTELAELAYSNFIKSPIVGIGAKNFESLEYMGDNPYELPAKDGVLGTFFIYLPLIWIFIKCNNIKVRFAIIILLLQYMQRPFHINLMHYVLLFTFCFECDKNLRINASSG